MTALQVDTCCDARLCRGLPFCVGVFLSVKRHVLALRTEKQRSDLQCFFGSEKAIADSDFAKHAVVCVACNVTFWERREEVNYKAEVDTDIEAPPVW